jgi:hypothetical protein
VSCGGAFLGLSQASGLESKIKKLKRDLTKKKCTLKSRKTAMSTQLELESYIDQLGMAENFLKNYLANPKKRNGTALHKQILDLREAGVQAHPSSCMGGRPASMPVFGRKPKLVWSRCPKSDWPAMFM